MNHQQLIRQLQQRFNGFNGPADYHQLEELYKAFGTLPDEILDLYKDHNGSARLPVSGSAQLRSRHGSPNGDSAVLRLLVRMNTAESRAAVGRLRNEISGRKKQILESTIQNKHRLQPPRWY